MEHQTTMSDFNPDVFFDLDDAAIASTTEAMTANQIEQVMIQLQNHVDELNRKRGIVASVYSAKREAEAAAAKLSHMSDDELAAELERRKNAQTISGIGGIVGPGQIGGSGES